MTRAGADRVRVTVVSSGGRSDLVLPTAVPVAELLPGLLRGSGLLGRAAAGDRPRLLAGGTRELLPGSGLTDQQVEDGAVLTLTCETDPPPHAHDDLVAVVADVVEHDLVPWSVATGRRTALGAGAALLLLGAGALLGGHGPQAWGAAGTVALVGVAAALVLSRRGSTLPATLVAWLAVAYAVVALVRSPSPVPWPVAGGAAAALVAASFLRDGGLRLLLLPAALAGVAVAGSGLLAGWLGLPVAAVLTGVAVLVAGLGDALVWLARVPARLHPEPAGVHALDRERVADQVTRTHEVLASLGAASGLLLVVAAPAAASLGPWGATAASVACLLVLLRARHHRTATGVLTGLASGLAGLVSLVAAALWLHPDWRLGVAAGLVVTGGAAVLVVVRRVGPSLRLGRLAELAETLSLVSLPPLLVAATGLLGAVQRLVP